MADARTSALQSTAGTGRTAGRFALLRALRVHQWVKNLLLFVPALLDHRLFDPDAMTRSGAAFAAFCCASSGGYILNDLLDLEADRRHPTKRDRPFASGALAPALGLALIPALFGAAVWIGWTLRPSAFLDLLLLYMALTAAYSFALKRLAVVDVLLLAGLYTLRVIAGVEAAQVRFSTWLLAFSTFLFLSLAFLKRYTEVRGLEGSADLQILRRGYQLGDEQWLSSMGSASGYLSVLVLALYINSDQVMALYSRPLLLWLVCPLLLYWTSRMWLLAFRGRIHDDPIVATVRDPTSYLVAVLVALTLYTAL
ncbi:MAG: UbiA family prenyltransferase [Gemmatimonadales bacterium]